MKLKYLLFATLALSVFGCEKEGAITPTKDLGIVDVFTPGADEDPRVISLYKEYEVWARMDFENFKEVSVTPLYNDANCRGVTKIDDADRSSAITYCETMMSNVGKEFSIKYFPMEYFFVKQYGTSWWIYSFQQLGRNRLVIEWPNKTEGALPVVDSEEHYYQDSVLTTNVWSYNGNMIASRIGKLDAFELAGKAYDNGEAVDNINKQYDKDKDKEKRDKAYDELCRVGGYITSGGSRNFTSDLSSWIKLLATESAENIKVNYLDNSITRKAKYDILIKWFNEKGWDITAAGNKFRLKYDEYKSSLPEEPEEPEEPEPEPEPEV